MLESPFNGVGRTDVPLGVALIRMSCVDAHSIFLAATHGVAGFLFALTVAAALSVAYLAYGAFRQFGLEFDLRRILRVILEKAVSAIPIIALCHSGRHI